MDLKTGRHLLSELTDLLIEAKEEIDTLEERNTELNCELNRLNEKIAELDSVIADLEVDLEEARRLKIEWELIGF